MALVDRMPWRPGADPLPIVEIIEHANEWAKVDSRSQDECKIIALGIAGDCGQIADAAIGRMIASATTGGPGDGQ